MRALVIGGDGNLARTLVLCLRSAGHEVAVTSRRGKPSHAGIPQLQFDLRDPRLSEEALSEPAGLVVYIMAAITGIAACETDPDAWRVNAEAPVLIAQQARDRGWHVISMSSGTVERMQHSASARQKAYADMGVVLLGGCAVRPLPFVPPERYGEIANLLVRLGAERATGIVRWEGRE